MTEQWRGPEGRYAAWTALGVLMTSHAADARANGWPRDADALRILAATMHTNAADADAERRTTMDEETMREPPTPATTDDDNPEVRMRMYCIDRAIEACAGKPTKPMKILALAHEIERYIRGKDKSAS